MHVVRIAALSLVLAFPVAVAAGEHLITVPSRHGVKETIDRLESAVKAKGMAVFARIDHAAGAKKVGKTLRPTVLLIFGNPKVGTTLLECQQTIGIDLPLKALAWRDAAGKVWLGYDDPQRLADRHGIKECGQVVETMKKALGAFAGSATAE